MASGFCGSAAIAGASAWAFSQIGEYYKTNAAGDISFGGNQLTAGQVAGQITAHAVVGGVTASLQGGKFGHGFFSAGVTKAAGGAWLPGGDQLQAGDIAYGTVVSAVIGGTASEISGGKFSNGARTAVFQYLFNQVNKWAYEEQARARNVKRRIDIILTLEPSERNYGLAAHVPRNVISIMAHGSEDGYIDYLGNSLSVDDAALQIKSSYGDLIGTFKVMLFICNSG